jgi:hypothetical protein
MIAAVAMQMLMLEYFTLASNRCREELMIDVLAPLTHSTDHPPSSPGLTRRS